MIMVAQIANNVEVEDMLKGAGPFRDTVYKK